MRHLVKTFTLSLSSLLVLGLVFIQVIEPSMTQASSSSTTDIVTLGVNTGISVTGGTNTSMSQSLGLAANSATATTTLTVITNDASGYTLTLNATSSPAMVNTSSSTLRIADYATTSPSTWNITSGTAAFGFSAYGSDVNTSTWGTGSSCSGANLNATSTTLKYKGFFTTPTTLVTSASSTSFSGNLTNLCYAVEQKNYFVPVVGGGSNSYVATIIATATTN
jgi:hypothetical protein